MSSQPIHLFESSTVNQQQSTRRSCAAAALERRCPELPAAELVDSLAAGITQIRDLLITRVHDDVERYFGMDSTIAPISETAEQRQARKAKVEIEIFSAIVVADEVARSGYVDDPDDWFQDWLFELRLGPDHRAVTEQRVEFYGSPTVEERRLKFVSVLHRIVPEAAKAPLVLFRLFPRAMRIVTAVAFGDPLRAQELRAEQEGFLPAVGECHECHGRILDSDDSCRVCGNPVWKFAWLQTD